MERKQTKHPSEHVTEARASAQRAKLDAQDEARRQASEKTSTTQQAQSKHQQKDLLAKRRARATIGHAIADYLLDHEGGNHSDKTLQWHQTALGLLQSFLQEERGITLVGEVDAPDSNAWFAYMRKTRSVSMPIVLPPGTVLFCGSSMIREYGSPSCVGYVQWILIASTPSSSFRAKAPRSDGSRLATTAYVISSITWIGTGQMMRN
jgi:hypothetical protein